MNLELLSGYRQNRHGHWEPSLTLPPGASWRDEASLPASAIKSDTLALGSVTADAAGAATLKADAGCCVLRCDDPKHETPKPALRTWLAAKGMKTAELTAAVGTAGKPKSGAELVDGLKQHLRKG